MPIAPIKTQLHPVVKIIIIEFLRYWKYSFTAPVYIFLALFPIITAIILLLIGIDQLPPELNYAPGPEATETVKVANDTKLNAWISSITKDDLYRWYWYVTLFLYGFGSLLRKVLKKIGYGPKPWSLGKKIMVFTIGILLIYAIPYGIFRIAAPGAIPLWVVAIFSALVLVIGIVALSVGHILGRMIAAVSRVEVFP